MPNYEYQCEACGHHLEALQKLSDKALRKCPDCGKPRLQRLISSPVFRLKGSGWYETDFKSDKEGKRNLAGADKEETKPEAKPDSKVDKQEPAPATAKAAESSTAESKHTDETAPARKSGSVGGTRSRTAKPKARRPASRKTGR